MPRWLTRRGKRWTIQAVLHVLKNVVYIGTSVTGRVCGSKYRSREVAKHLHETGVEKVMKRQARTAWTVKENEHEAIIEPVLFYEVQERIKADSRRGSGPRNKNRYALSSLATCAVCGASMSGSYLAT